MRSIQGYINEFPKEMHEIKAANRSGSGEVEETYIETSGECL